MPFEDLPTFPQGGEVTAQHGTAGIPPESFQQALRDSGTDLLESTRRPEDFPAVQAAIGVEVDTLARQMTGLATPPFQGPSTPASPDTSQQPYRPATTGGTREDAILRVLEKYRGDPQAIAKAYIHTDAARTQAQQQRAVLENQQASEIAALRGEMDQIRQAQFSQRYAPPQPQAYQQPVVPNQPANNGSEQIPEDPEEFFKKPAQNFRALVRDETERVVRQNIQAMGEAQRQYDEEKKFTELRIQRGAEIERYRPIMDQLYVRDRDIYDSIPQDRALSLLLERAQERAKAAEGRQFFEEIQSIYTPNGTPANAAPGQRGALPQGQPGQNRMAPQNNADWSNTAEFNRLWKTRSDSVDEDRTVQAILKQRGFGDDIPIY